MPVKITITCDMPEPMRSTNPDLPRVRCYSSVNENVVALYEGIKADDAAMALATLRKTARFQGWGYEDIEGRRLFICPGCRRKHLGGIPIKKVP